ncbi:hypothetical protein RZS08_56430, partial [Arthrospira platensis SPKY1]|nr:hypothetical protein [Arthrospira platensis SPKY1]
MVGQQHGGVGAILGATEASAKAFDHGAVALALRSLELCGKRGDDLELVRDLFGDAGDLDVAALSHVRGLLHHG